MNIKAAGVFCVILLTSVANASHETDVINRLTKQGARQGWKAHNKLCSVLDKVYFPIKGRDYGFSVDLPVAMARDSLENMIIALDFKQYDPPTQNQKVKGVIYEWRDDGLGFYTLYLIPLDKDGKSDATIRPTITIQMLGVAPYKTDVCINTHIGLR